MAGGKSEDTYRTTGPHGQLIYNMRFFWTMVLCYSHQHFSLMKFPVSVLNQRCGVGAVFRINCGFQADHELPG